MTMKLMTKEIESKMPVLYSNEKKRPDEIPIIVKFFDPTGSWTWYVTEGEQLPDGTWNFFGLVRGFETELGYFSQAELESVKGAMGLGIERDLHFGKHNLAEAMEKRI